MEFYETTVAFNCYPKAISVYEYFRGEKIDANLTRGRNRIARWRDVPYISNLLYSISYFCYIERYGIGINSRMKQGRRATGLFDNDLS